MNVIDEVAFRESPRDRPDIVIVIVESLRPEMVTDDVMPHVTEWSRSGLRLNAHYSGGNATSLGMFSIVSGMEAVWFYKSDVRFAPAMNRLFRQAGYELGFFGGHDDWAAFQMDAFISPRHFDRFRIEPMDWLASDERAIESAGEFLKREDARPPRLAIVFLYSTHAPMAVDPEFATDQPAASAAYPIPFPASWRDSVWNRYRNAARTLDDRLRPLLDRRRVIVVTGDHGESFLDDGTVGHGTRLTQAQIRVAATIAGPGVANRTIDASTTHADWLPTLLAVSGLTTSMPDQFDGLNLAAVSEPDLRRRIFSVSHLIGKRAALVSGAMASGTMVLGTMTGRSTGGMDGLAVGHGGYGGSGETLGSEIRVSLPDSLLVPAQPAGELTGASESPADWRRWLDRFDR